MHRFMTCVGLLILKWSIIVITVKILNSYVGRQCLQSDPAVEQTETMFRGIDQIKRDDNFSLNAILI